MLARRQRRRSPYTNNKLSLILSLTLLLLGFAAVFWHNKAIAPVNANVVSPNINKANMSLGLPGWPDILYWGIPGLAESVHQSTTVKISKQSSGNQFFHGCIELLTGIDVTDLRSLLGNEIPLLTAVKANAPKAVKTNKNMPVLLPKLPTIKLPADKPFVAIYHTHTAEAFVPNSGAAHKPGGQRGDIVLVGEKLSQRLKNNGVPSIHSKEIHDYPSFMKAYNASEITVKQLLAEHPSIQMVFDIHRDADKKENSTTVINGLEVARLTIVVASGQPDLVQPNWQENHAFAKLIDAKLNEYYPGVSKGILIVPWRYNQHLHPRALLLEIGCQENTLEEAERTIELFGDIITQIIAENKYNGN